MLYGWLADGVLLLHFGFLIFVVLGGLLVWRSRRWAWIHVPLTLWGILAASAGLDCPLTPLETALRQPAGQLWYSGGFIEHYITRALYPEGLTRPAQVGLGMLLLLLNLAIYGYLLTHRRSRPSA